MCNESDKRLFIEMSSKAILESKQVYPLKFEHMTKLSLFFLVKTAIKNRLCWLGKFYTFDSDLIKFVNLSYYLLYSH